MAQMSLLEHLKALKTAIPIPQKQPEIHSKLHVFRQIRQLAKKERPITEGIFTGDSFCFPLLDPLHDPSPAQATTLIRGVFEQGGQIVEFHERMREEYVKFVVVWGGSTVEKVMQTVGRFVKFEKVLRYEYVWDCLSKFKKLRVDDYLLFDNTQQVRGQVTTAEIARMRLEEETIDQRLIRPKLATPQQAQSDRKSMLSTCQPRSEHLGKDQTEVQQAVEQSVRTRFGTISASEDIKLQRQDERSYMHEQKPQRQEERPYEQKGQSNAPSDALPSHLHQDASLSPASKHRPQCPKLQQSPQQQQQRDFKWQNKRDRRVIWYAPPKDLASKGFPRNDAICAKLKEFYDIYCHDSQPNTRKFQYIRSIAQIKSHPREIRTVEDLREVQGLAKAIFDKIRQLIETGHISKLENFSRRGEISACQQLQRVWGVGTKKAKEFYDKGIRTVEDLRAHPQLISKNMAVGLKYFEEFNRRIPREKVARVFDYLKGVFFRMARSDRLHQLEVVGSYRRGKADCGDIDLLICRQDGGVEEKLVRDFVRELQKEGFITESLSQPRLFSKASSAAYMGVCLFEGEHHRIDIKHYPVQQYAFALLYFTGSDIFNRQTRMAAHNLGLQLSDHGLTTKERNGHNKIYKGGKLPVLRTEQEIFSFLGLDYCTPQQREM